MKRILNNQNILKFNLVVQSLSPLALLIITRNFVMPSVSNLFQFVLENIVLSCVMLFCLLWLGYSVFAYVSFSTFKYADKKDGYLIEIDEEKEDASLNFFSTLIIPLLLDDVAKLQGAITFLCIVIMLLILLCKTNLFYANPVLAILGYHIYVFHFCDNTELPDCYIGLSKGVVTGQQAIEYKKITEKVIYIRERIK